MKDRVPEFVEVAVGSAMLVSPLLVAAILILWTRRVASRGGMTYVPFSVAACCTAMGAVLIATAAEGMGGIPQLLFGVYLGGVGAAATLACAVTIYTRSVRDRHKDPNDEVSGHRFQ